MENNKLMDIVGSELYKIGGIPIYVTKFGSELYGLNTENSDEDLVCIYLPPKRSLVLSGYSDIKHCFSYKTKKDDKEKNTSEDIDIKFFSIQNFLKKLSLMEVEACDVLYSVTNKDTVLFDNGSFRHIYDNRHELMDITNKKAFIGYGINQVKKYGLRGTSVGIAKSILKTLGIMVIPDTTRIHKIIIDIVNQCLPFDKQGDIWDLEKIPVGSGDKKIYALRLFGSYHPLNITLKEFRERVQGFYDKYGERSKLAEKNNGIDWKAASHGLRSILNYTKLIEKGDYSYPFKNPEKDLLMNIKLGKISWEEYESIFQFRLGHLEELKIPESRFNPKKVEEIIIEKFY